MARLNDVQESLVGADIKALVEADLLNPSLDGLTYSGQKLVESMIFNTYKDNLIIEAKKILKERKKAC